MGELILNNLPIVLFLVITIAVRVLQSRSKAAARREKAPPVFASSLEPDEEEEEAAALIAESQSGGGYIAPAAQKTAAYPLWAEEDSRFDGLPGLSEEKAQAPQPAANPGAAGSEAKKNAPAATPEGRKKSGGFFPPLEQLTPLQRAVVWAEILGKPKGME
ncbi:MAG: hypothetical protein LBG10_02310 [Treponema sp.]|jgi:hypothetical protein|nr:hypothetical protein [Treponema sp.]